MKKNFFNNVIFFLAQMVMVFIWLLSFGMVTVVIHTGMDVVSVIQGWGDGTIELNFEVEAPNGD